jgi:anti-sigma factor RsiW
MRCIRIGYSKKLIQYLHGSLSPFEAQKVEQHASQCKSCNAKLSRLMEGDAIAKQIPAIQAKQNGWSNLQEAILKTKPHTRRPGSIIVRASVAIVLLSAVSFFMWHAAQMSSDTIAGLEIDRYREVAIREMPGNVEPHVVTEGYISEVRVDHHEGDLVFKLVESLEQPSPFVICEIIPPFQLDPPEVGNKVRVYGVSRYDPKENHQWYEVHPVMGIEKVE